MATAPTIAPWLWQHSLLPNWPVMHPAVEYINLWCLQAGQFHLKNYLLWFGIILYWPRDSDALWLGRQSWVWAESNGSLLPGLWLSRLILPAAQSPIIQKVCDTLHYLGNVERVSTDDRDLCSGVDLSSAVYQQLHYVRLVASSGQVQRSFAAHCGSVGITAVLQKEADNVQMSHEWCHVQRSQSRLTHTRIHTTQNSRYTNIHQTIWTTKLHTPSLNSEMWHRTYLSTTPL